MGKSFKYEFKPDKDFTSITRYFLEEDNEEIELMEIECGGDDGLPVYISFINHSSARKNTFEENRAIFTNLY